MNTPFEIKKLYKEETSNAVEIIQGRTGKYGDIIIDEEDISGVFKDKYGRISFFDPNYVEWLEEKVMLIIKK